MTDHQKQRITNQRGMGESYARIAGELGLSENTVKSFCRRHNLLVQEASVAPTPTKDACEQCGAPLHHMPGFKKKRFCSDACRMRWWNAHPEIVKRKAVYSFTCPSCGIAFSSYGNAHRKYCSRACFGKARRAAHG